MKNKQQHIHRRTLTSLTLILTLLLVAPGVAPAATAGEALPMRDVLGDDHPDAERSAPAGLTDGEWATMRDLIRQAEYQFAWQVSDDGVGVYRAPNRANDLLLSLAADGFHVARYREGEPLWDFGLSLTAYGEQTFPAIIGEDGLVGNREQVEYHWSLDVVEWYTNSADGVEHGLTLAAPPAGADGAPLELAFALRGSLTPELDGDGQTLRLKDTSGQTALRYDQLTVYDAAGKSLPAHFSLSLGGAGRGEGEMLHLVIDTAGAAYPLTVDPVLHGEVTKLTATSPQDGANFGDSVAISGDTVVVGAPFEDEAGVIQQGAAYIFERNQDGTDSWGTVKRLTTSDPEESDIFGTAVAISGDTIVVGASLKDDVGGTNCGVAYVYERNYNPDDPGTPLAENWGEVAKLTASDASDHDAFGRSVAISGDTIVVGADLEDGAGADRGAVYVFERNWGGADVWGQRDKLVASDAANHDYFGNSVAISDDTVVVGAYCKDAGGTDRGAAYIFERNQGGRDEWGQVARLTASDGTNDGLFGHSVAISGDTLVVGASGQDGVDTESGAAYVFERNQGGADVWGQVTNLTASDAAGHDHFGSSVAISSDTVVVGAQWEGGTGYSRGAAYTFERNRGGGDNWGQRAKLSAADAEDSDLFGCSVAISADTVVVGALGEDGVGGNNHGAAYLFVDRGGRWLEVANPHASGAGDEDHFGLAVAISGDTAIVGADLWEGSSGSDIGAAYVLERNEDGTDSWGEVERLLAADGASDDYFGRSVSISGDTIVVGAWGENGAGMDRGAAYVFERNYDRANPGVPKADNWGEVTKLTASDAEDEDHFGYSVGISNDTIVVGARGEDQEDPFSPDRGAAYIFERNKLGEDNWGEVVKLTASDGVIEDYFGYAVAISDDTVIVGAYKESGMGGIDRGAAYLFARNQGGVNNWGQVKKLTAAGAAAYEYFGCSVAISGDTAVVGAYSHDGTGTDQGAAYVFERNDDGVNNWGQVKMLRALDAADNDYFGIAVAISNDTVVVGAHGDGTFLQNDQGAAYVFERNYNPYVPSAPVADNWGQVAKLRASDAATGDYFGRAVAISGDQILVGAYGENGAGTDRGAAYVFTLQPYKNYLPLVANND